MMSQKILFPLSHSICEIFVCCNSNQNFLGYQDGTSKHFIDIRCIYTECNGKICFHLTALFRLALLLRPDSDLETHYDSI